MIAQRTESITYTYHDAAGAPKYEVLRYPDKVFRQRQVDGHGGHSWNLDGVERVPYRLPQLLDRKARGYLIIVVEGEKDADRLVKVGFAATTNAGGANWKWTPEFVEYFRDAVRIAVIADCDEGDPVAGTRKGREAARDRVNLLLDVCEDVRLIDLAPKRHDGFDVSDWLDEDHTREELVELIEATPRCVPPESDRVLSVVANGDWPELVREVDAAPLPPPMPEDLIPEPLRRRVVDISERMCVPIEMVAAPTIVSIAALVGRSIGIRPRRRDDWLVVPNLWGGVVARPGLLKTPVIGEALKPLGRLAVRASEEFEHELERADGRNTVVKIEIEVLEAHLKAAIKKSMAEDAVAAIREKLAAKKAEAGSPLTERRYITHDATIEKLGELLCENQRGLLQLRDELVGWLRLMDRSGHEGDRAFYLEAWNGNGSYTFDRIGRGTIHIPALTLSAFGGITPGALSNYVGEALSDGRGADGLLQRLQVIVWPGEMPTWKSEDREPDAQARDRVYAIFERLDTLNPERIGAVRGDDSEIPYVRFSPDGQELFDAWRDELEKRLRDKDLGDRPAFESHLAKYRSLMPSLALLFHLVEVADGLEEGHAVSVDAARRAAAWCEYLETHAERIYASEGSRSAAGALARHIESGDVRDGDDVRSIYRHCWSRLGTAESVTDAARTLEDLGWLRLIDAPSTGGRPASPRIQLNPDVGENR